MNKLFTSMLLGVALSLGNLLTAPIVSAEPAQSAVCMIAEVPTVKPADETIKTEKMKKRKKIKDADKMGKMTGKDAKMNKMTGNTGKDAKDVNVNTATQTELEKINGIGKSLAKSIIAYRTEHGKINSVDDLKKVKGIGKNIIDKIKTQIVF